MLETNPCFYAGLFINTASEFLWHSETQDLNIKQSDTEKKPYAEAENLNINMCACMLIYKNYFFLSLQIFYLTYTAPSKIISKSGFKASPQ